LASLGRARTTAELLRMFAPGGPIGTAIQARLSTSLPAPVYALSAAILWNPEFGGGPIAGDHRARAEAAAQLLGLLRAGELSAEAAFGRITRRLPPAAAERMGGTLQLIRADEARHGRMLTEAADHSGLVPAPPAAAARRFFAILESRDPSVHVGRIAALDACVCQILSRVLAADRGSMLPPPVFATLESIRRDEGRHVRTARTLAREFGIDSNILQCLDLETRQAFDRVLCCYEPAFLALHVDAGAMRRQIRRDER